MNSFDLFVSSFINGFAHRSIRFDEFVTWLSESVLLKGCVVIGIGYWLWFQSEDAQRTREALLATIMASFPALVIARVLSWVVNRTRPLIETRHLFRLPYGERPVWEGPSSFPSDHAVLFFALATGIFIASRRTGWFVFVYVSIVICLPRIYLAEHYATDILAGAAIGVFMAWLANISPIRKPLTAWALGLLETRPGLFYCCAFIVTCQMAELFDPIIKMLKAARVIVQGRPL
jgi:undecaprenyl-diphosphatase